MSVRHDMQAQRFELKYMLPCSMKEDLRAFIASYLVLDEYAEKSPTLAYGIHSIYFDSPNLSTYQATEGGDRNRFKLRLRYYDENEESPVFLEMKRRFDNVIAKKRCMIPRHAIEETLAGDTTYVRPKELAGHQSFCHLMNQLQAGPRAHVAYQREAWMSEHDNSVRVTLDTDVFVEPKFDLIPTTQMKDPVPSFGDQMVLELKYTNRFPGWFRDLVEAFHLMQSGGPKYSAGVKLYGEEHFMGSTCQGQPLDLVSAQRELLAQPAKRAPQGDLLMA
jgi:hypothetical protein